MTQSSNPLLVGIDLGTTNIKAAVYNPTGSVESIASVPTETHYPKPLWAYYDPDALWDGVCRALRGAIGQIDSPERIASVAIASVGETGVPIDSSGEPVYDAIAWFDRRTIPQEEWIRNHIGEDRVFETTGLTIQPIYSLLKLRWLHDSLPDEWSRTTHWLMAADYIAFRMSGAMATDYSLASRTMAFNISTLDWDSALLEMVGISPDILAEPVQSGTRIGSVIAEASRQTLLPEGIAVGAGGHDHVVGALGVGAIHQDRMIDSMGTAEALFFPLERPVTNPSFAQKGYSQGAHAVPDMFYMFGGVYTSSACIEWIRNIIGEDSYEEMIQAASLVPAGSLGTMFLPHLRLSNAPHPDSKSRAAFVGLTSDVNRGAMLRSIYEGIAFEARATIEPALEFANFESLPSVIAIGGGSRNEFLVQVKASVLDSPIHVVDLEEATSLGAAMLGGVAAGVYRDHAHAVESVEIHPTTIDPLPDDATLYETLFNDVYVHLYESLREINHTIHDAVVSSDASIDSVP